MCVCHVCLGVGGCEWPQTTEENVKYAFKGSCEQLTCILGNEFRSPRRSEILLLLSRLPSMHSNY